MPPLEAAASCDSSCRRGMSMQPQRCGDVGSVGPWGKMQQGWALKMVPCCSYLVLRQCMEHSLRFLSGAMSSQGLQADPSVSLRAHDGLGTFPWLGCRGLQWECGITGVTHLPFSCIGEPLWTDPHQAGCLISPFFLL